MCLLEERREVAFHEAGHAIEMVRHGIVVQRITVIFNEKEARWDGKTIREVPSRLVFDELSGDPSPLISEASISFGGCLAQAKFISETRYGSCSIDEDQEYEALLDWMENQNLENLDPYPLSFSTTLKGPHEIELSPRSFGGLDRGVYIRMQRIAADSPFVGRERFRQEMTLAIIEVIKNLNMQKTWNKVRGLAEALLSQNGDDSSIEGTDLNSILNF